ncbi:hypothetical protein EW146_g10406, partial [Bondarzewia mesenterica]
MSATITEMTTVRYPTPPPTLNKLDAAQRRRLMSSARKLGKVLGTQPILVESDCGPIRTVILPAHAKHSHSCSVPNTPTTKRPPKASTRRHGSIFNFTAPPSPISSSSSSPNSSTLYLPLTPRPSVDSERSFLPNPPSLSSKPRRSGEGPPPLILAMNTVPLSPTDPRVTPTPSTPQPAMSPTSPITPKARNRAEIRRTRMAKLQRTLGENVPSELVFPSSIGHLPSPSPAQSEKR